MISAVLRTMSAVLARIAIHLIQGAANVKQLLVKPLACRINHFDGALYFVRAKRAVALEHVRQRIQRLRKRLERSGDNLLHLARRDQVALFSKPLGFLTLGAVVAEPVSWMQLVGVIPSSRFFTVRRSMPNSSASALMDHKRAPECTRVATMRTPTQPSKDGASSRCGKWGVVEH